MSTTHALTEDHHEPGLHEIRLKGHLDKGWADWFEGLTAAAAFSRRSEPSWMYRRSMTVFYAQSAA
jgi:hypothetical protein